MTEFMHREVPLLGRKIHRIGIVGNYGRPKDLRSRIDAGGELRLLDAQDAKVTPVLRVALKRDQSSIVLATGPTFSFTGGSLRKSADSIRKLLDIDQIDILQQFWLGKTAAETDSTREALHALKADGVVRHIGTDPAIGRERDNWPRTRSTTC